MTTTSPAGGNLRRLRRVVMVATIAAAFVPTASAAWAGSAEPPAGPDDVAQPELGCPANPDLCPPPGPGEEPDDGPPPQDPCENPAGGVAGHAPGDCQPECPDPAGTLTAEPVEPRCEPECPDPAGTLTAEPADPRCEPECPDPADTLTAEPADPQCGPPPTDGCEPAAGGDECDGPDDDPVDPAIPARPTFTG